MSEGTDDGNLGDIERRKALAVQIQQFATGIAEAHRMVNQMAVDFAKAFEPMRAQIQNALESAATIGADIAATARALGELWGPTLIAIAEGFNGLPPEIRRKLIVLGQHGWYLDPQLTLPADWDLAHAFEDGRATEADAALSSYFTSQLTEIEGGLVKLAPARAKLVRSAFEAHRRGEYELAIPVLLAQTDGISVDATGGSLFRDTDGSPLTAAYVRGIASDEFLAAMLAPLAQKLPINATEKQRGKVGTWTALNRHMVLHGESLNYGTETNSLKAISLLNYVACMLLAKESAP
jgi:hypothetical protein